MIVHSTSQLQVYPSRITITNAQSKKSCQALVQKYINKQRHKAHIAQYKKAFKASKNPFVLSKASKKKIFDSINSMYCLSKPRKIEMKNGKKLYNFQLSFITLTLPSKQSHSDTFIKSECLNQLLVELRKHYGVQNYVWKAELQGNQNIHFHLILDKYVDYQALRRRWNRILNKHDYVDRYSNKMSKLTLSQYHDMRNAKASCTFGNSKTAFAAGRRSDWSSPNSVDVRMVRGKKDLAIYLGKYIAKEVQKNELSSIELERQLAFGRSWSRSYSLAKLKYRNKFLVSEVKQLLQYLNAKAVKVKKVVGDFFHVYFFNVSEQSESFRKFHNQFIFANAKLYNYPLP